LILLISGCAKYTVKVHPDGTKELNVFSWRKFPEGAVIDYGEQGFQFGTPEVTAPELTANDLLNIIRAGTGQPTEDNDG
jgi:hypothetical protein